MPLQQLLLPGISCSSFFWRISNSNFCSVNPLLTTITSICNFDFGDVVDVYEVDPPPRLYIHVSMRAMSRHVYSVGGAVNGIFRSSKFIIGAGLRTDSSKSQIVSYNQTQCNRFGRCQKYDSIKMPLFCWDFSGLHLVKFFGHEKSERLLNLCPFNHHHWPYMCSYRITTLKTFKKGLGTWSCSLKKSK